MIHLESYIKFIIKNKLTQTQFLLLYILHTKRIDLLKDYKNAYPTDDGSMLGTYWTNDLITRGYLEVEETPATNLKEGRKVIKLTNKFPNLISNIQSKADEILECYPGFSITQQGQMLPLTIVDIFQFRKLYSDIVGNDPIEHEEILKDIEYGKFNKLINFKIDNFISSKFYLKLRELRKENKIIGVVGYNTNEL